MFFVRAHDDTTPSIFYFIVAMKLYIFIAAVLTLYWTLGMKFSFLFRFSEPEGCTTVLQLEHLNSHQGSCEFSTNLEMVCDKGCNLTVKQCKYQHNCLVHLADRLRAQDEKIYDLTQIVTKFNEETIQLHAQLSKLSRGVTSQQKRITKLNGELNRLRPQNEELHELCNDSTVPAPAAPPQWQKCFNMNVSIDQPNILEFGHSPGSAFAQSLQSLNEANLCFQTQILSDCGPNSIGIGIGLTQKGHPADVPPGHSEGSIGYRCCGQLYYDKCESVASHACKVNDIIECGIKFLRINSCNSGYRSVVVYFSKNGLAFLKKVIRMPLDGLFPTIFMFDIHLGRTMKIKIL